jgi:carbamoyltransferase
MKILGISAFYHDSAAALIENGKIVAAAQQERFSRRKHDARFPHDAIQYCLSHAGIAPRDLDHVVFYDKPFLKFERLLETYLAFAPRGFRSFKMAMPLWVKDKLFQKKTIRNELRKFDESVPWVDRLLFSEHHLSHAASAYFPSPYSDAAILTMDGVGEWATTSIALGRDNDIEVQREIHFPHSLGLLYSAFTYYTGFKVNSGEYKLMGLAPYGDPRFVQTIFDNLIDLKADGSFRLNLSYFDYCVGLRMTNEKFGDLFGKPPRQQGAELTQFHMDVAASIQKVTEEIILSLTRSVARETGAKNLCLAGGVALNCVANGAVLRDGKFDSIWIQSAAGDAGGALGAALAAYHLHCGEPRVATPLQDKMQGALLGPEYSHAEICERLRGAGAKIEEVNDDELLAMTAEALDAGKVVGWFQGRMEFGPRALGARSILGDPRSAVMQSDMNLKIKFRESFRPFAPCVLREDVSEWFDLDGESPYMLIVADVAKSHLRKLSGSEIEVSGFEKLSVPRSDIPAITHVDGSARVQTVDAESNPRFHALLKAFKARTGCPVLVNTSFNVRGEPIVCTPEDAFRCFMGTGIEMLAVGNCLLRKEVQDPALLDSPETYRDAFERD